MQIVIPMSGQGTRFKNAGYSEPKPLIQVHGRPIIEYVVNLFPGENSFIFICSEKHLQETEMRQLLLSLKSNAKIIGIAEHKLGPVFAVSQAFDFINDEENVIVNYCDFFMNWDYEDFKKTVSENDWDACLPVYTGFHPHLLPEKNLYASIKINNDFLVEEIREKYSYTLDKTLSNHSPGIHYFKHGKYVKKYFQQLMGEKIDLNGEYYVSLVFNLLVRDGLRVGVYNKIDHFCQWGTPEDLAEYNFWINNLKNNPDCILFDEGKLANYNKETIDKVVNYWRAYLNKNSF